MDEDKENKTASEDEAPAPETAEELSGGAQTAGDADPAPEEADAEEASAENSAAGKEPPKRRAAWIRCTSAVCAALLLLCLTGFGAFRLMTGGRKLSAENLVGGRYLTFNVDTIVDYLAEDYKSETETVTGRYALVPVGGTLVVVHLPQRYLDSANTIASQTYYQLYGATTADKYFVASGTVKKAPDEIVKKYETWYNTNALSLYQYGFINSLDEKTITYMVDVDSTGLFSDNVCLIMTYAAAACVIYALIVFLLIKKGRYDDDITVEIVEEPADGSESADAIPAETEAPAESEAPAETEKPAEEKDDA